MSLAAATLALLTLPQTTPTDDRTIVTETTLGESGKTIPHGTHTVTAADGTELVSGEFKDGKRSGRWVFRHDNGEFAARGKYSDGVRAGTWTSYWPNGESRSTGKMRSGKPRGEWSFYDVNGRTLVKAPLVRVTGANPTTGVRYVGWLLDGKLHGPWNLYWPDGSSLFHGTFEHGCPVGLVAWYHAGGVRDPRIVPETLCDPVALDAILVEPEDDGTIDAAVIPITTGFEAGLAAISGMVASDERERLAKVAKAFVGRGRRGSMDEARESARWALAELSDVDWSASDPNPLESLAFAVVDGMFGEPTLAWVAATDEAAVERNQLAVLRAHSRFRANESSTAFWRIDAQIAPGDRRVPRLMKPIPRSTGQLQSEWIDVASLEDSGRRKGRRSRGRQLSVASDEAEDAFVAALQWLAESQSDDGSWNVAFGDSADESVNEKPEHRAGVSALAIAALQRGGNSATDGEWSASVASGLRWLIEQQDPKTGRVYAPYLEVTKASVTRMNSGLLIYDHCVATWVLCRALRESPTPRLRDAAKKAVDFLQKARNHYAVWRYSIPPNGENDTSVSTWALRALVAARRAGIEVDDAAFECALTWVDKMTDSATGRVGYFETGSPSARVVGENEHYPADRTEALTACGMVIRAWCGQTSDDTKFLRRHAELLLKTLPEWEPDDLIVDFYYWMLGAEAMHAFGEEPLEIWIEHLEPALVDSQRTKGAAAGSWDPVGTWCFAGGRVYATAMAALALSAELTVTPDR
ncbi:MAG: hypothetical protein AAGA20_24260 [Planctomycetota bacterium]